MTRNEKQIEFHMFNSHEEAEEASIEYYGSLTPDERLDIALELMRQYYEAYPRLERIYRTAELGECPVSSDWRVGI